jgi:hypothetical protein
MAWENLNAGKTRFPWGDKPANNGDNRQNPCPVNFVPWGIRP